MFIRGPYLDAILVGTKRFEIRMSLRSLACAGVGSGDVLLLKRSGGEVEAACDVGDVFLYRGQRPEQVAGLVRPYADAATARYVDGYIPPRSTERLVNVAIIELLYVRGESLAAESTLRSVRSG